MTAVAAAIVLLYVLFAWDTSTDPHAQRRALQDQWIDPEEYPDA